MEVVATAIATATPTATARHELVPQLRFPPGFRFVPTEEELVDVYLRAKIEGHKLPLQVVNDVSILDWQPGSLVEAYKGYGENRWFFFTVREQSSSNKEKEPSRKVRVDGVTATWKATGSVQLIRRRRRRARSKGGDGSKVVVGTKRVLIYNSTDPNENGKWSMHEYILQGHAEIGQYALYSIQRKQHSDTEDKVGNDDMDPEKKNKKRKRTEKPCTGLEGAQLPHPETTTLLAKPPLKPTRKAKAQRKKKPSMQAGVEGEEQQQQLLLQQQLQQGQSSMEPVTPPKKDELVRQQEGQQQPPPPPVAADGAPPPTVFSAVPLQAVRVLPLPPSEPDGTIPEASVPTLEETLLELLCEYNKHPSMLCSSNNNNNQGQEQWLPSMAGSSAFLAAPDTNFVDHAWLQTYQQQEDGYGSLAMQNQHLPLGENQSVYMWQEQQYADLPFFPGNPNANTTQPMMNSSVGCWEHGDGQHHRQVHQQQEQEENNGGVGSGVEDRPMNNSDQEHSSGSDDLQVVAFGDSTQMDELEVEAFFMSLLVGCHDEPPPEDLAAGTQEQEEGDGPATLQAAGTADGAATSLQSLQHGDLQSQCSYYWQVQRARYEHVRDGPCSCMVCAPGP